MFLISHILYLRTVKEKLAIETERLYADKSRPGYLDNCFTPEETDTILNAIQGAWSIDEYVGFAPYHLTYFPLSASLEIRPISCLHLIF